MDIAVDLGSDRTRVFIENKGIVLDEDEARNLFELIHKRRKKFSTIFCS